MAQDSTTAQPSTADEKAVPPPLEVKVEDAGPARKRLTITVPPERITGEMRQRFDKLQEEAAVPGFRRGHAPQRLIERRFGAAVKDELRVHLLSETFAQAVEQEKLQVIGQPDIKDAQDIKLPEQGALTFQAEVEVVPQVQLPPLEGIAVTREPLAVTDEDVKEEIERLRRQFGQMKQVHDGAVKAEDYVLADVRILAGADAPDTAEELLHHPGTYILVPGKKREDKGHVVGIVVENLAKKLVGQSLGQTVRFSQDGPPNHEDERIKGKPITMVIRLDRIERLEPAADAAIAQQLGVEPAKLTEYLQESLKARKERQQRARMHAQLEKYLLDHVEMDLPEGLSGRQTARVLHRQAMQLAYMGLDEEKIKQRMAELRSSSEDEARKQLKLFFILNEAAKKLNIEVSEAEVNGRVALLAAQQNRRPEKLRQQMMQSGELEQLYLQLREHKTLDKILETAKITEGSAAPADQPAKPSKAPKDKVADQPPPAEKPVTPAKAKTADQTAAAEKPAKKPRTRKADE